MDIDSPNGSGGESHVEFIYEPETDRCCQCGTSTGQLHEYNGELYCNTHLAQKMVMDS